MEAYDEFATGAASRPANASGAPPGTDAAAESHTHDMMGLNRAGGWHPRLPEPADDAAAKPAP